MTKRIPLRAAVGACLLLPFLSFAASAGTTGKISGRVTDKSKQPLAGVNVSVPDARLGASTDVDGRFAIINVPVGAHTVKISLMGYQGTTVTDVGVSADHTTRLDVALQVAPIALPEVTVSAQRPVVDLNLTSTMATVDREQISKLPVQELADVVNLQAGVVDGHFRGGRKGEVQYQVDGVTVNNVYDNTSTLRLDRSLLEEVQVISGTFDAEYGQAMSGVVNAVLRRGTDQFRWDAEVLDGSFAYQGSRRDVDFMWHPAGIGNYEMSASGPTHLPKTYFLASGQYRRFDDWVYGRDKFRPTDAAVIRDNQLVLTPSGDSTKYTPLAYSHEWSGLTKITNHSLKNIELNYQAVVNLIDGRKADYAWRLDPDGLSKQRTFSITHGLDWTHTLDKNTYYTLNLRQNYFDYRDRVYDPLSDPRYDAAGLPGIVPTYGSDYNVAVQGVQPTRFRQQTNAWVTKGTFVSQLDPDQQIKTGAELQWPVLRFGAMGYIEPRTVNGIVRYVRIDHDPPDFPGVVTYRPVLGAAFAQDELEWNDLKLRAGLRFEFFDARSTLPSDLRNPANALPPPTPQSVPKPTRAKVSFAPRIGVSYPVTKDAALFFAYGHFYQLPPLGTTFNDADYNVLSTLQAGTNNFRVMGNPDIKPERTVQYQFGYRQAVNERLGFEANAFYKDIRDLLGVQFINTYNDADYARLTNVDFGNVIGVTLSLDQRAVGLVSTSLDYTWQVVQGNSSKPEETATRAEAGQDPRPRLLPFDWDQRHTLNLTVTMARPDVFTASLVVRVASGQPFTPTVSTGLSSGPETNSGRKPAGMNMDLRAERQISIWGTNASLFTRVFNVFDTRFFNGFVFSSTGSPYYSQSPTTDRAGLQDPTRFYGPRRIEVGVTMGTGQKR